jgi:hypothetical protein
MIASWAHHQQFQLHISFIEVEEFVPLNWMKKQPSFCTPPYDMKLTYTFVSVDSKRRGQGSAWFFCSCGKSREWQRACKTVSAGETPCADSWVVKWGHYAGWIHGSACHYSEGNDGVPWARFPKSCNRKYEHGQPIKISILTILLTTFCQRRRVTMYKQWQ